MAAEVATGSIFAGDYRVIGVLGSGGMGTVYEVEQLSTRKHRALKLLESRLGHDEKAHHRFVREATVGAQVRSEHVVEVIGAGIDSRSATPWLAMELLDGADLKRVVESCNGLSLRQALSVFRQLGHGLTAAHRAGVIHRDLKPENIFVARSRRAGSKFMIKILDFGIAKLTHELTATTDTGTVGSPLWMAPEQLNALPVSARTDVWALGLLGFWILTGKVYWKTAHQPRVTVQALFAEQLFSDLEPPTVRAEKLGSTGRLVEGFDAWFSSCVNRDPEARFENAGPAIAALESILEPAAVQEAAEEPLLPPSGQTLPPPGQSGPVASVGARSTPIEGTTGAMGPLGSDETFAATTYREGQNFSAPPTEPEMRGPAPSVATTPRPESSTSTPESRGGFGRAHVAIAVAVPAMIAGAITMWVVTSRVDTPTPEDLQTSVSSRDIETSDPSKAADPPHDVKPTGDAPPETDLSAVDPPKHAGPDELDGPSMGLPEGDGPSHRFMGWTVDGDRFALRSAFGVDGRALEVVQVHDGVTGARLERYVVGPSNARAKTWPDNLSEIVEESGDANDWTRRRVDLLLLRPDPRRAPEEDWELRMSHRPVPAETTVQVLPKRRGFDFRWYGFERSAKSDSALLLWLDYVTPRRRDRLLKFIVPLTYAEAIDAGIEGRDPPTITGTLASHWSPDRTRCVLMVSTAFERGREPERTDHWFMRAAGPQIELVDAGAGRTGVRAAAVRLAEAELTTARFGRATGRPPVTSEIVYAAGEASLAEQIRQALGRTVTLREDTALDGLAARVVLAKD